MLAVKADRPPVGEQWVYELKWDGIRALVYVDGGRIRVETRRGRDITGQFPELTGLVDAIGDASPATLDGELVVFTDEQPDFGAVISRMQASTSVAGRAARKHPATLIVFDVLEVRGEDVRHRPWTTRRAFLDELALDDPHWRTSVIGDDADDMIAISLENGLEGIMAKKRSSTYHDRRTRDWVKIKHRQHTDLLVGGWHETDKGHLSLLVGEDTEDGLKYRGRVSQGVDTVPDLRVALDSLKASTSPFNAPLPPHSGAHPHWVDPILPVEVEYGSDTPDGQLRHAKLVRVRIDLL